MSAELHIKTFNAALQIQMSRFNKLLYIKWCFGVANWSRLSWKQQSGTHKIVHFVFSLPTVTSCFAGGAIFNRRYIRCNSCAQYNAFYSLLFIPFYPLDCDGSRMHQACISQAHSSYRKLYTLPRLMENTFTNSSSSLCRNRSSMRDNFQSFIIILELWKMRKLL